MSIKLRHYQAESTPAVLKYWIKNPSGHPVVAIPTAGGKTFCIADLIQNLMGKHKILVLSHVKEILEQNHASLETYLGVKVGLYSAMLGRRDIKNITVAGIQSVYSKASLFKGYDIVIVDEAHLVNADEGTRYEKFFSELGEHNRVGFTATPYRLGQGYIYGNTDDTLFDKVVCDWTLTEKFNQLIEEGFLCKLTTKRTTLEMDTEGIKLIGGDFSDKDLSERFDRELVTNQAILEILAAGKNRKKWLIFAIDIKHAEHIAETLIRNGIPTAPVHSKMSDIGYNRNDTIQGFRDGKYRCIVNVNILTTGFDYPSIDLIACLRPTSSPVLHVQSLGRGSRISPDKDDCLVLDFAGNTARIGPINNPLVKIKGKAKEGGEPITKTCPECESILAPAVRVCPDCGFKFPFQHGLSAQAANNDVIEDGKAHWIGVHDVEYTVNANFGSPSSVKVIYKCGNKQVSEFICVEHKGFAKHKADHWVKYRGGVPCANASELISQAKSLLVPSKILVQKKGRYHVVNDAVFEDLELISL
jgi:DNA repair protein RadD